MAILAGDIGGTKTLLQLADPVGDGFEVLYEKRYASADYLEFKPLILDFAEESFQRTGQSAYAACMGVAGPVSGRTAVTTNLPWQLDADELEFSLGIPKVKLINDFQAVGYGIEALQADDLAVLQTGRALEKGNRAIIGAGTGLGMGMLVWQEDHYEVVASEGGHSDFAPDGELQLQLQHYLKTRYRWASWERAVSGRGLVNIFEFLLQSQGRQPTPALAGAMQQQDAAAAISEFALSGQDPLASQTLDLFVRMYGAQAGNLALLSLATGGVYIAGGIAPKILNKIKDGVFLQSFLDKDEHMQSLLKAMPVSVITNENVGVLGSAVAASRL